MLVRLLSYKTSYLWEVTKGAKFIRSVGLGVMSFSVFIYLFTLSLMLRNYKIDAKMVILAIQNYE